MRCDGCVLAVSTLLPLWVTVSVWKYHSAVVISYPPLYLKLPFELYLVVEVSIFASALDTTVSYLSLPSSQLSEAVSSGRVANQSVSFTLFRVISCLL